MKKVSVLLVGVVALSSLCFCNLVSPTSATNNNNSNDNTNLNPNGYDHSIDTALVGTWDPCITSSLDVLPTSVTTSRNTLIVTATSMSYINSQTNVETPFFQSSAEVPFANHGEIGYWLTVNGSTGPFDGDDYTIRDTLGARYVIFRVNYGTLAPAPVTFGQYLDCSGNLCATSMFMKR
jgi:hypothetical protein